MDKTLRALRERGAHIEYDEFDTLLARKIAQMIAPRWPCDNPDSELPAYEIELLREGGFPIDEPPNQRGNGDDPVATAAAEYGALLATGLDEAGVAALLNVTPARVRQRRLDHKLFALADGEFRYPALQFAGNRLIPGLDQVLPRIPEGMHPVSVARWLRLPNPDLRVDERAVSPLDWLNSGGEAKPVATLAADL